MAPQANLALSFSLPLIELVEGFYLVNSGATGVAASFMTIGAIYAGIIVTSSMIIRRAQPGYITLNWQYPNNGPSFRVSCVSQMSSQ